MHRVGNSLSSKKPEVLVAQIGEGQPFVSRQRVYFDMLDLMGMLHNVAYLLLFERARTDYWRSTGVAYGEEGFDWPYVVARNEIDYRASIHTECEVDVSVAVEAIGRTSITFVHTISMLDGAPAARGRCVIVRIDPVSGTPIPWTNAFRRIVAPITVSPN